MILFSVRSDSRQGNETTKPRIECSEGNQKKEL